MLVDRSDAGDGIVAPKKRKKHPVQRKRYLTRSQAHSPVPVPPVKKKKLEESNAV